MRRPDPLALAERVEVAMEADLNLDLLVSEGLGLVPSDAKRRDYANGDHGWWIDDFHRWNPPAFTSDPLAALRLIEQRWPTSAWRLSRHRRQDDTLVYLGHIEHMLMNAVAHSPACALTAALLRAEVARRP